MGRTSQALLSLGVKTQVNNQVENGYGGPRVTLTILGNTIWSPMKTAER